MKKLLSILLCITLLNGVSGFPTAAAADLNIDSYYVLPESMTVDSVTIGADGQVTVSDEKTLSVQGDIDSMAEWASLTIDNARLNVEGDLRANIPDYATVLQVMDGSTADIGGSIIRNTNPDTYGYTIEAGSRSSQGMRPSYVRVGQNVQGNIYVYGGSSVDIQGHAEGGVEAEGEGTSVTIGDYVKEYIDALNGARVSAQGHAEGGVYASGEGTSVTIGDYVEGGISAYDQAGVDVRGHAEGGVYASGEGTSVTIGNYVEGLIRAYDQASVDVDGDVVNQAKAIRDDYVAHATAIAVDKGVIVTAGGNVSAINSDGSLGTAIIAYRGSSVDVLGHAEGGVYAEGEGTSVTIGDYVEGGISAYDQAGVDVRGHAEGGVSASGEGTSVTIGDYVKEYINAFSGSRVDVQGHAEGGVRAQGEGTRVTVGESLKGHIKADSQASVDIEGHVEGEISAIDQASVNVNGNVVSWAKALRDGYVAHAIAIMAGSGAVVTADGNVSAINSDGSLGTAISASSGSSVDVQGHAEGVVQARGEGISVTIGDYVKGYINAYGGSSVDVQGHAEGGVYARGEGSTVSIGDSLEGQIRAYDQASVAVDGDVVSRAKAMRDGYVAHATAIMANNGATVTAGGNVSAINSDGSRGTAISAYGGSSVDVQGHAEGEVYARGEGTSVTIGDYVNGQIRAYDQASVDVQGHAEGVVNAGGEGTHVTIGDGVSPIISASMPPYAVPTAIHAYNGAKVDVTGDADGLIDAYWGGMIDVSGNAKRISIDSPIVFTDLSENNDLGSSVRVGGNVADGVFISMYGDGTDHSKLTVEGTISSRRDAVTLNIQPHVVMDIPHPVYPSRSAYGDDAAYQQAMEQYQQAQKDYWARENELLQQARNEMNTAEGVQTIIDNLPQIIVGTLAPEADFVLVNDWLNEDNRQQVTEALLSQINYIVNMEGVDTANIAVYGYEELDGYLVAKEQQKLTVKCINDQMVIASVSAGRYATIGANTDGSYTITVQRGGDLNLVVTARPKVPAAADNTGRNSAYDEALWGSWLSNLSPDYERHILILDLTTIHTTDIPYDTLRAYMVNYGIDTMLVITGNAEYTMSLAELIALGEADAAYTFSARDGALELAVNGIVVSTFSVE